MLGHSALVEGSLSLLALVLHPPLARCPPTSSLETLPVLNMVVAALPAVS